MANELFSVVSPSLLENLAVHPTPPQFSLGMEYWTKSYLESLEQSVSDSLESLDATANSSHCKSHPPGPSSQLVPLQPRPQVLHLSYNQLHPSECEPPAKKGRFFKLSKEELGFYPKLVCLKTQKVQLSGHWRTSGSG